MLILIFFVLGTETEIFYNMKQNFKNSNIHGMPRNESVVDRMKDEYSGNIMKAFMVQAENNVV